MLSWRSPCLRLFTVYLVCRPLSASSHASSHSIGRESFQPLESWGRSRITMATDTGVCVVYVTAPSMQVAETLSKGVVHSKLAACVNIMPQVTSVYTWEGKVEQDQESLMMIKTRCDLVSALTSYIQKEHPYDVPEVISVPVTAGSAPYIEWVKEETKKE